MACAPGRAAHARADIVPVHLEPSTPAADDAEPAAPTVDLERQRDERVERLVGGLVELERWLDDRVRTGLGDPSLARYATWDELAARLVDARAGALANRVRRLAGVVGARPDWHEIVLAELGILHLLARAGRRVPDLPSALADVVATACGWQVRQADVLAGVPDTDTWVVAGRSDTREDRIEVRRTWLHGTSTGRWAMLLSFAAYRQSLDTTFAVGETFTADLHRYPGSSWRALVGARHDDVPVTPIIPPTATVAEACDAVGAALAAEPWLDRVPVTIAAAPTFTDGGWVLTDATGSLGVAPEARRPADRARRLPRRCRRRDGRVDRRRRRAPDRSPPRSGARHRSASRPLLRERGMTITRALARAGHDVAARHRPA